MDNSNSSCIEDTTCTASPSPLPPPPLPPLQRVGSGDSSVILDPDTPFVGGVAVAESRKFPSSQYKGVVPQPNGRWGAQIYEKHQRVWLGTFNVQSDAARAYDVAAQRFRGRDAATNFKPLSESNYSGCAELDFLAHHSKSEIVDMLRKHTYADELHRCKRASGGGGTKIQARGGKEDSNPNSFGRHREHLFDKAATPSDVGKLNRLVIPKQHAERHFPLKINGASSSSGPCKGMLLNFEDSVGKVWRFRYSYWNSSQSYVLTKGWSRFVKDKCLQAGDVVSFHRTKDDGGDREQQLHIECRPRGRPPVEVVRLFGVNIFKVPAVAAATIEIDQIHVGIKRSRYLDLDLGFGQFMKSSPKFLVKKQCVSSIWRL